VGIFPGDTGPIVHSFDYRTFVRPPDTCSIIEHLFDPAKLSTACGQLLSTGCGKLAHQPRSQKQGAGAPAQVALLLTVVDDAVDNFIHRLWRKV
jgi:hypothetical protein